MPQRLELGRVCILQLGLGAGGKNPSAGAIAAARLGLRQREGSLEPEGMLDPGTALWGTGVLAACFS